MTDVTIQARENGPYLITGDVEVVDASGRRFVQPQGKVIALCRCGHSGNKPYCDGSHKRFGFQADDPAKRAEG
jgi:CDGSH-type Zn-finger protein